MTTTDKTFLERVAEWQNTTTQPTPRTAPTTPPTLNGAATPYGAKALADECATLAATTTGRNHQLNISAFNLAGLVAAGHLDRQTTIDALTAAAHTASTRGDHPLTDTEIHNTIESGFRGSHDKVGARTIPEQTTTNQVTEVTAGDLITKENTETPPIHAVTLEAMERDFWTTRPELNLIYTAALSRMASPWAVLACCAARTLALVPPEITLPPIIGGIGSLNWFAAISAKSGGGKGAAMNVADNLVPEPVTIHGIGSGEGMVETYRRSGEPEDYVTAVMFSVDEIDTLAAMRGRSGQTTMTIIRQGFSGERLGFSYRGRQGESVGSHTYRMTLVAAVQPGRSGALFDDAAGGTPQRFQWFPGRDKRITATPPTWPTHTNGQDKTLTMPTPRQLADAIGHVKIPDTLADTLRQARADSMSGDDNALDGHALFCREKFSFFLALIAGRTHITDEDWRLAGIAADVSDWCRTRARAGWLNEQGRQSRERGALRAVENDERGIVEHAELSRHLARIADWIVKTLTANGPSTQSDLYRRASSRDRPRLAQAVLGASEQQLIRLADGGRWTLP